MNCKMNSITHVGPAVKLGGVSGSLASYLQGKVGLLGHNVVCKVNMVLNVHRNRKAD